MDALCEEYAGFFRFAKILETVASGIASGKIKVPGGRIVNKEHKLAAAIDLRVRQLEAKGIGGAAMLEQMVGHILDLQWLWSTVSDEKLAFLCRAYPGLYRYGMLAEQKRNLFPWLMTVLSQSLSVCAIIINFSN
jgi:hypothetical protein